MFRMFSFGKRDANRKMGYERHAGRVVQGEPTLGAGRWDYNSWPENGNRFPPR